jgi:uncharacterized alkaline shock family protein YloU
MAENKQLNKFEYGNVNISDDVIEIISTIAAQEIKGVSGLSGTFTEDLGELFGKKNYKKGVAVEIEKNKVKIDLNVIVDFGVKIPEVAYEIQEAVKKSVESMTGLKVMEANIHVQGVNMKQEKADEEE